MCSGTWEKWIFAVFDIALRQGVYASNLDIGFCRDKQTSPGLAGDQPLLNWLAVFAAFLEQRRFPAFALQSDMCVRLANSAARAVEGNLGLRIAENGRLRFDDASDERDLSKLVRFAGSSPGQRAPIIFRYFSRDSRQHVLSLLPLPVFHRENARSAPVTLFIASVRSTAGAFEIPPGEVACAFQLTPAEASLATALVQGVTLREYSERANVKISTVRWHMKNIYERTETRSQSELVCLILSAFG